MSYSGHNKNFVFLFVIGKTLTYQIVYASNNSIYMTLE